MMASESNLFGIRRKCRFERKRVIEELSVIHHANTMRTFLLGQEADCASISSVHGLHGAVQGLVGWGDHMNVQLASATSTTSVHVKLELFPDHQLWNLEKFTSR